MNKRHVPPKRFAICITDSEPDLELRKVYQVLPDVSAAKDDYIRVIDESGEDYLYPSGYFVFVEMPRPAERALKAALKTSKRAVQVAAQ
ncbi:MAG: hypothetical protein ACREOI_27095 [bacterium]